MKGAENSPLKATVPTRVARKLPGAAMKGAENSPLKLSRHIPPVARTKKRRNEGSGEFSAQEVG